MHTYVWQDKFNIGIQTIDAEHINLLICINKLITAQQLDKAIILKLADEVVLYAKFHFLSEENLMCLTHYPELTQHTKNHLVLIKQLENKRQNLSESITILNEFVTFLVHWFIDHTMIADRKFAEYLKIYSPHPGSPEFIIKSIALGKMK